MFFNLFRRIPDTKMSLTKDQRGIAAVEFALVVPIIIILLLGSVDAVFALTAKRKVSLAAHSMADIVSRETGVSEDDLDTVADLGKLIMTPNDVTSAQIVISGAVVNFGGTTATVDWSSAFGPGAQDLPDDSTINLPSPLTQGIFLVVASTRLPYETLTRTTLNLNETAYFQSRSAEPIDGP